MATFCIETKGTQEYRFDRAEFITRFETAYGKSAADEIAKDLNPRLIG